MWIRTRWIVLQVKEAIKEDQELPGDISIIEFRFYVFNRFNENELFIWTIIWSPYMIWLYNQYDREKWNLILKQISIAPVAYSILRPVDSILILEDSSTSQRERSMLGMHHFKSSWNHTIYIETRIILKSNKLASMLVVKLMHPYWMVIVCYLFRYCCAFSLAILVRF